MHLVKADTAPRAWLKAARYLEELNSSHDDYDVILHIAEPTVLSVADKQTIEAVDRFLTSHGGASLHTVAETIFPKSDYERAGRSGVFEIYPERMSRIHEARSDRRWGCYALRSLRQIDLDGKAFNPLERIIEKMSQAKKYNACYELVPGRPLRDEEPVSENVTYYDPATDRNPYYGNLPCLSLASFKFDRKTNQVRLNATYRSHYYMQRTLGNLMGLARLQYFVANEVGAEMGPLTVNSTYAKLDTGSDAGGGGGWGMANMRALIAQCESYYES
tara:strand:+ start:7051 stop:7875 length:825 start_codon:yes stop_codon:yes gene_type:complete